jgi:sigma-B regulation protein RsbU (phosphoserine phosphatase)
VSGDYCDIIISENEPGSFYFLVGDVTGKGVAASLLMSHLHATFRSLATANLPVDGLVKRANRIFCEGTLTTHFATLICGKANRNGEVEICNAGHCLPLHVGKAEVKSIPSTGLPLGLFCDGVFESRMIHLEAGDRLVLYTDGLSESRSAVETSLYGDEKLEALAERQHGIGSKQLVSSYVQDVLAFRSGAPLVDDLTIMAVGREK